MSEPQLPPPKGPENNAFLKAAKEKQRPTAEKRCRRLRRYLGRSTSAGDLSRENEPMGSLNKATGRYLKNCSFTGPASGQKKGITVPPTRQLGDDQTAQLVKDPGSLRKQATRENV